MTQSASPTSSKAIFQHGLMKPERRHMTTLFTLMIFWLTATFLALVLLPFQWQRYEGGFWTSNDNILFLSIFCFVSTLWGTVAYLIGYPKGAAVRNFFIGAIVPLIGVFWVWWRCKSLPDQVPAPSRGATKKLDRLAFMMGNIWFGIAQLLLMFGFLIKATVYETQVGEGGNRAAYASYYNHWTFGLLFVVFFVTLYCATMRKWPFRISQIGWLSTHLGLLTTMVGCMVMFWGTYDGYVKVTEGETITKVNSRAARELRVKVRGASFPREDDDKSHALDISKRLEKKFLIEIDHDPAEFDVQQEIPFTVEVPSPGGGRQRHDFVAEIDHFFSRAEPFIRMKPRTSSADEATPGAEFELHIPDKKPSKLFALENWSPKPNTPQATLSPTVVRVATPAALRSLGYIYPPNDKTRGRLLVLNQRDEVLAEVPVKPGLRPDGPRKGALVETSAGIGGSDYRVTVDRYFSQLIAEGDQLVDASPNQPAAPGIYFTLSGPNGKERHHARFDDIWLNADTMERESTSSPFRFRYEVRGSVPLVANRLYYLVGPGEERHVALSLPGGSGIVRPFEEGGVYRFSRSAPVAIRAIANHENAKIEEGFRQGDTNRPYGIKLRIRQGNAASEWKWVLDFQRDLLTETFLVGDFTVDVGYCPVQTDLPFSVSLLDFRHENYPNNPNIAKTYEANILVNHDADGDGESELGHYLVDMNHPLAFEGYRFFNGSPRSNDQGRRGVIFTVGGNPGMPTLLIGFTITFIGLVLVFFFKPKLRKIEAARRPVAPVS